MRRASGSVLIALAVLFLILSLFQTARVQPVATPEEGLLAQIVGAAVDGSGVLTVRFTLTDGDGVPIAPTGSSTTDPSQARVRFTVARLEVKTETDGADTVQFTRYLNYVLNASGQPAYDTGGSFAVEDEATGIYRYTFGTNLLATALPGGFNGALVHTVGAQVERVFEEQELAANPIFDFVPDDRPTTAAGAGGGPHVRGFDGVLGQPLPGLVGSFFAYNAAFLGGVRVALCDLTGDGVVDVVTGPGPGGGPHVRAFDGVSGAQVPGPIGSFLAFDGAFAGGVFVACGEMTGDGTPEVIVGADQGGGPHVRVFDGKTAAEVASFFALDGAFLGGVRVAACDVNQDGRADIVAAAGPGGEPRVRVLDGTNPTQELASFLAYGAGFGGGVFVGCGSVRGATEARIVTGAGPGGGPHVRMFTGTGADTGFNLFAYTPAFSGGVSVAACDVTGDGTVDVVTGAGPGGGPHVRTFDGASETPVPGPLGSFFAYNVAFTGGVAVACDPGPTALTVRREPVATATCNGCHNPLSAHGGNRREVRLCQLCHTEQAVDPETGNTVDFKVMVHRIHRGKELPSVEDGPVGTKYSIIGFQGSEFVAGEKIKVCVLGPKESAPCSVDADCGAGGTCSGEATAGIGFPQDIRSCTTCHTGGATSENFRTKPSTAACTSCHDKTNPSTADITPPAQLNLGTLLAGVNHDGGAQPEAKCGTCHGPGDGSAADEATESVTGAHTVPQRSVQLPGLVAEILDASGTAGSGLQVRFRLTLGDGTPITSLGAPVGQISVRASQLNTDFGGHATTPYISQNVSGATGPDVDNAFTFTTTGGNVIPAGAAGTWRVGLEARRSVNVTLVNGATSVTEFAQNPVFDFSVDGSDVETRRTITAIDRCQTCHGVFSKGFSIHGGSRNQVEHCIICHNPNVSDFARRVNAYTFGAGPDLKNEPIGLKHLLHKVHTGEELATKPYIVYGFGSAPKNYTAHEFAEIRFPGARQDCATCHVGGSQFLPLVSGALPTRLTEINTVPVPPTEVKIGEVLPATDACLTCHGSGVAAAHAQINTLPGTPAVETCEVCHREGAIAAVSKVHQR